MSGGFFGSLGRISASIEASNRSAHSSILSSGRTAQGDAVIYLDRHQIDDGLPGWREMQGAVEIEFLGRGISSAVNQKHWAWLIKGRTFFCTIEYGQEGIVIQYFKRERGLNTACAAIMGDGGLIFYDDRFRTSMTFDQILILVDSLKTLWNANTYSVLQHNCRDFARQFGRRMDSTFNPPTANIDTAINVTTLGAVNLTFPRHRSLS